MILFKKSSSLHYLQFSTLITASSLAILSSFSSLASAFTPPSSWDQLAAAHPTLLSKRPIYQNSLPTRDDDIDIIANKPILYRDKDCICAASETVWLAMECKNIDYVTVLVSKKDNEEVPRIVWPKSTSNEDDNNDIATNDNITTDPVKLLEQIQSNYPDNPPNFFPKLSSAVDASRCNIMRLPGVMPRYSNPRLHDYAPYIFKEDGTLVKTSSHCVSLEEVEEMQEEYYLGSFLCGRDVTAADMVWGPYLERYAIQLPLIYPNNKKCNPRSTAVYEEVDSWYRAMETKVPAYACAVQGDGRHWRKCLEYAVKVHNEEYAISDDDKVSSLPSISDKKFGWWMTKKSTAKGRNELWKQYASDESRSWLADTPSGEVAAYLTRNRNDIVNAAVENVEGDLDIKEDDADEALRELVQALLFSEDDKKDKNELSENGQRMAKFASERIEVPKDLGMIPAMALGDLVLSTLTVAA